MTSNRRQTYNGWGFGAVRGVDRSSQQPTVGLALERLFLRQKARIIVDDVIFTIALCSNNDGCTLLRGRNKPK